MMTEATKEEGDGGTREVVAGVPRIMLLTSSKCDEGKDKVISCRCS